MSGDHEKSKAALQEVAAIVARTRRLLVGIHVADHFLIWGMIWVVGFGLLAWSTLNPGWIWGPLSAIGAVLSFLAGQRAGHTISGAGGMRILGFFALLGLFSVAWAVLLYPFNVDNFGAYVATVFMFGYAVGGLWFGRFFLVLGTAVTIMAVGCALLAPQWLNAAMSVGGGGALIGAGLHIKRTWK